MLRGRPQDSFGSGRVGVWSRTAGMLSGEGRLWTGTGPDTFAARFRDYVTWYNLRVPEEELIMEYYDTPHCEYLALLADCGVPALLCFLALVLAGCFGALPWKYGVLGYAVQFFFCRYSPVFGFACGEYSTAAVSEPTRPSPTRPLASWNSITAAFVAPPNCPSISSE